MTRATEPAPAAGAGVRLSASLPKDNANGLRAIAKTLVDDPQSLRYALIAYDVARLIDDLDTGTDTAVVRIQRIEPLTGEFADRARALVAEAAQGRGGDTLNFDEEDEQR